MISPVKIWRRQKEIKKILGEKGTILTWTKIHTTSKDFKEFAPYPVAIAKLDNGLTPESFIEGYDKVTSERVMEVANKYLPDRENGNYVLYIRDPLKR